VPQLVEKGGLGFTNWGLLREGLIYLYPSVLHMEMVNLLLSSLTGNEYVGYLNRWQGRESAIDILAHVNELRFERALDITRIVLNEFYCLADVVLLNPPFASSPPLVQEVWQRKPQQIQPIQTLAEQAIQDPQSLSSFELSSLVQLTTSFAFKRFVKVPFYEPTPFRVGSDLYNVAHPVGDLAIKCIAWLFLRREKQTDVTAGLLSDSVNQVLENYYSSETERLTEGVRAMTATASAIGIKSNVSIEQQIEQAEIWHNSVSDFDRRASEADQPFGQQLV
jgi:hypothetical protein